MPDRPPRDPAAAPSADAAVPASPDQPGDAGAGGTGAAATLAGVPGGVAAPRGAVDAETDPTTDATTDWLDRATAVWTGDGLGFDARTRSGHVVPMDATPAMGGREHGPRPMELLLVGLAGCTGMDVLSILAKMRQRVTGYVVRVRDRRLDAHPKRFAEIVVEHVVRGPDLDPAAVERAVRLSAEKYCPASAALAAGCPVRHVAICDPDAPA